LNSGDERQRIAIARVLKPAILFLDEANSALDEATEQEIVTGLRALAGDMTIIAVTPSRTGHFARRPNHRPERASCRCNRRAGDISNAR
jgi:ABC-type uncharacterized transport system fused permease/ATPase subunit